MIYLYCNIATKSIMYMKYQYHSALPTMKLIFITKKHNSMKKYTVYVVYLVKFLYVEHSNIVALTKVIKTIQILWPRLSD